MVTRMQFAGPNWQFMVPKLQLWGVYKAMLVWGGVKHEMPQHKISILCPMHASDLLTFQLLKLSGGSCH